MKEIIEALNTIIGKYCSKDFSQSYFIRKDEGVFIRGFNEIWLELDFDSLFDGCYELKLLAEVIELKRHFEFECVYFEVKLGKLFDRDFITCSNIDCKPVPYYSVMYFSILGKNKFLYNDVYSENLVNQISEFLMLFKERNVVSLLLNIKQIMPSWFYTKLVSNYINKACIEYDFHEKVNIGYFRYLAGLC